jgi:catechol 2,3-dioxygenase-like lactoylglutathione lyase family enzyme
LPGFRQIYAKLPAQDVARARSFYAEKLGLEPFAEQKEHLYYELAGSYFILFPSAGGPSGTHDQLGFVVDDIERTVAELESRGVEFELFGPAKIADHGVVKAAWLKDSEGNLISFAEFVERSPFASG